MMDHTSPSPPPGTKTPAVSVVIPVFISKYVGEAVASVLAQTFSDYEIIVVNDGSPETENLERILAPYMSRILYLKQEDEGPSSARNKAIRYARGDYLAFLDHDDVWLPGYLATQMEFLRNAPGTDLVYCDARLFGSSHHAGRTFLELHPAEGEATLEALLAGRCTVITTCTLLRRSAALEAGLFDETIHVAEDYDLWLRLVLRGAKVGHHSAVLARRRVHDRSATLDNDRLHRSAIAVLEKFSQEPGLTPELQARAQERIRQEQALIDLLAAKRFLRQGRYAEARDCLRKTLAVHGSLKLKLSLAALTVCPWLVAWMDRARTKDA